MSYAVLTLTFEDVANLLQLISVAAMFKVISPEFHRAGFFRCYVTHHASWRSYDDEGNYTPALDDCEECLDMGEWAVLPTGYEVKQKAARTDADTVNVDERSVLFAAYDHNGGSVEIETQPLSQEMLLAIGKQLAEQRVEKAIQETKGRSRVIDLN